MDIIQSLLSNPSNGVRRRQIGDQAAALVTEMIGANALTEDETRNLLSIIRAAFEKPDRIPDAAKEPSATSLLLRRLLAATEQASLKQQIAETMAYVQPQPAAPLYHQE